MGQYDAPNKCWEGILRWMSVDGRLFEGQFTKGKWNGYVRYFWPDKSSYVGSVKDGERHGQGTHVFADGSIEEGNFSNGIFCSAKEPSF